MRVRKTMGNAGLDGLSSLERARLAPISEIAELTSLSPDTLRRHYKHLIVEISPRRQAMRIGDALTITTTKIPA
jgi:hypothetical protein